MPFNASAGIWRDAHMLCLVHNLATQCTEVLRLPVLRYRFDPVESNLNALGTSVGAFHGMSRTWLVELVFDGLGQAWTSAWSWALGGMLCPLSEGRTASDRHLRTIVYSQPFVAATPHEIAISALVVVAWTNFIKSVPLPYPPYSHADTHTQTRIRGRRSPAGSGTTRGTSARSRSSGCPRSRRSRATTPRRTRCASTGTRSSRPIRRCVPTNRTSGCMLTGGLQTFPACGSWTC
jgi:hypothetical protein